MYLLLIEKHKKIGTRYFLDRSKFRPLPFEIKECHPLDDREDVPDKRIL